MPQYVVIIGLVSLLSAVIGALAAKFKRRGADVWAFACFMFPPLLLVLFLLPKNTEPRQQPRLSRKELEDVKEYLFD
ncbi:hypothetical protein MnTg02_02933 [bacterium MnTg02]|nr:hypothetical protein MnTg02_02933 [bacterium MnTg02]